jgi:hypothetical protein
MLFRQVLRVSIYKRGKAVLQVYVHPSERLTVGSNRFSLRSLGRVNPPLGSETYALAFISYTVIFSLGVDLSGETNWRIRCFNSNCNLYDALLCGVRCQGFIGSSQ